MARGQMDSGRWIFFWIIMLLALGMLLSGCGNTVESEGTGFGQDIQVVKVDGHEYVVYEGYNAGGITHKVNCNARH